MKMTKVFAGLAAVAVSASALAVTSFAAITNANSDGAYVVDPAAEGYNLADITGVIVTVTCADGWTETGIGGGVVIQGDGLEWADGSKEFGVSGDGEDVKNVEGMTVAANGSTITLTYDFGGAALPATATWGQVVVQSWWGADFTVDSCEIVTTGSAPAETTAATTTAAETTTTAADTTTAAEGETTTAATTTAAATNNNTGVEGVAGVVALLAIAGTAVVVSKKN